jgi:uncharacterized protein (TIGR03663 family)
MKWGATAAWILVAAGALALRLPQLDRRPLHTDESVHAIKFQGLWDRGVYRYDPDEYHGPSLYYLTLPSAWVSGARSFAESAEVTYRIVPVLFGVGLILLLPLLRDGLGSGAALAAAVLTALSPAMVFFSRYYIHEMLLVFFSGLLLAASWRAVRSGRPAWWLLAGAALGLMHATKETFVLVLAAAAGAAVLNGLWARWAGGARETERSWFRPAWLAGGLGVALLLSVTLFSSFFTNPSGPLDSVRTYLPWLQRAQGNSPHTHPWHYYLGLLAWFRVGKGPVWTEILTLVLALVGWIAALRRAGPVDGHAGLVRYLGFYTLLLAAIYSLIPYKTPWCLLGFWHGFILLAGVGAATLAGWARARAVRAIVVLLLGLATGQLGLQAWRASYPYGDSQRNPYVYAHTLSHLLELVDTVEALAVRHPAGHEVPVRVLTRAGDSWPLPWYLRRFRRVEYDPAPDLDPRFPIVIVSPAFGALAQERLEKTHEAGGSYGLRPGANGFLDLFVERTLWQRYVISPRASPADKSGLPFRGEGGHVRE